VKNAYNTTNHIGFADSIANPAAARPIIRRTVWEPREEKNVRLETNRELGWEHWK